ncbi:MAG: hypothetical protein ACI8TX_001249 [Hyphomicrobiaceae bacterium]|jgi:hypothetical protein
MKISRFCHSAQSSFVAIGSYSTIRPQSASVTGITGITTPTRIGPMGIMLAVLMMFSAPLAGEAQSENNDSNIPTPIHAAVNAPDRSAGDRALNSGRHPAATLAFFGIQPGMRVA